MQHSMLFSNFQYPEYNRRKYFEDSLDQELQKLHQQIKESQNSFRAQMTSLKSVQTHQNNNRMIAQKELDNLNYTL